MPDDESIHPVQYPIDPDSPPVFPGKIPRELAIKLSDQLQAMREEVNPYLGPDHTIHATLLKAGDELMCATPFVGRYAEYTPEQPEE